MTGRFEFMHQSSHPDRPTTPADDWSGANAAHLAAPARIAAAPASVTDEDVALVRASLTVVTPHVSELAAHFYSILFSRYPQVRDLFPAELDVQRERLVRALLRIVELVDDPDNLVAFCSRLGRGHRKFGTQSGHYPAVGECLLQALSHFAGPAWHPALATAWQRAYTAAADVMVRAAEEDARNRPAVWDAHIVGHVHRGHGIAEITVRPHQPYPFVAGQYVSIETPWAPRQWRQYSPANAPRPNSELTFHVRAVREGKVSNALVHHARPGDPVRLGPPEGDMVLRPTRQRDLLFVAGGTGLAPIRALIEEVAQGSISDAREVSLFIGARTANELYGLDDMLRMSQRYHWLRVRAAVSDERIPGLEGTLPEVLAEFGPWYRHEAYLCGPPQMLSGAVHALRRHGVPPRHIHYDPWDTPVLTAPLGPPPPDEEDDQL
ncbi:oxidoreductase [Streptomyces lividans]|uniref:nitric oxide dioxygenase n=1 Tax=Streptomyces lividans TK24 TaxID=457428 RepID=A0ABN4E835_STRLI|nr:flavohemoprotein [Streptomyces lividans TK24]KKD10158.1 flavohemoprotein [Streptomyces sp. WM6391]MBQ0946635.1 flavohemoprotein [Streptomyces sp. RK76]QSJ13974.1 flavohemoprotein [Streptomyces lividans]GHB87471.1 oxidoreductase [Streptomyces anthocyanicus]